MSVGMSLLAILDEEPSYGLHLKQEFEARTGGVWPLNVGQVYTTLARLERDGYVTVEHEPNGEAQKVYAITDAGRKKLARWFERPSHSKAPSRDELVLKLVMAAARSREAAADTVQTERKSAIAQLQEYTRLKREAPTDADLGWMFLLDSLIFKTEARVRWLDACEARLAKAVPPKGAARGATAGEHVDESSEVHA